MYNSVTYLSTTINCILSFVIPPQVKLQVVFLDDCSTDGSFELIQQYTNQHDSFEVHQNSENIGIAACRKRLLDLAKGEYIAFQDSDDLFHPNKIEYMYNFMSKNPNTDILGSGYKEFYYNEEVMPCMDKKPMQVRARASIYLRDYLYFGCPIIIGGSLIKREFLVKHKISFDVSYIVAEDYNFYIRLAESGAMFSLMPYQLTFYRQHEQQITKQKSTIVLSFQLNSMERWYRFNNISFQRSYLEILIKGKNCIEVDVSREFLKYIKYLLSKKNICIRARYRIFKQSLKVLKGRGIKEYLGLIF